MIKIDEMVNLVWHEYSHNPLIEPPFPFPIIGDPTFLPPSQTPDTKWYLCAYSFLGIYLFSSIDGIVWMEEKIIVKNAIRPYLFCYQNIYFLLYEKIDNVIPILNTKIEVRQSKDLIQWGPPTALLKPNLPWHFEGTKLGTVGNPCVTVDIDGNFLLFYSAGLVFIKDCLFWEPKYIGCAKSKELLYGYETYSEPILYPSQNDKYSDLGAGSIKVIRAEDGYLGFQNSIYWDLHRNHSSSAIRILSSKNAIVWETTNNPIITPDNGWKKSHVYAMDVKLVDDKWIMYFNARDGWLFGKERIGMAYANNIRKI